MVAMAPLDVVLRELWPILRARKARAAYRIGSRARGSPARL